MKSLALTIITFIAIAYSGAFFEVWELRILGEDPVTATDVGERLGHYFDFTNDLRDLREDLRREKEDSIANTP
jgi:hypothetical protein